MVRHHVELQFTSNDPSEHLPAASARITVRPRSANENFDAPVISLECVGPVELEQEVTRLKADLDRVLALGVRKFAAYRRTVASAVNRK